jgi:hypothetical protein
MKLKEPMYPPEMMEFFWTYAKHPDVDARCSIFRQLVGLNNRSSDLDAEKKAVVERLLMTAIKK